MIEVARGSSLNRTAAVVGCSKRDAARTRNAVREHGVTAEQLEGTGEEEVDSRWFPSVACALL